MSSSPFSNAGSVGILTHVSIDPPDVDDAQPGRRVSTAHLALGLAIRQLRTDAGLSQTALADRCGLHRTYVGGIERGERNVSFGNLLKLAAALDVTASALLLRAERLEAVSGP